MASTGSFSVRREYRKGRGTRTWFLTVQRMNKALDKVRAAEVKQLLADGYEPILKGARWLLLKRPANQTKRQAAKLKEILQYNSSRSIHADAHE